MLPPFSELEAVAGGDYSPLAPMSFSIPPEGRGLDADPRAFLDFCFLLGLLCSSSLKLCCIVSRLSWSAHPLSFLASSPLAHRCHSLFHVPLLLDVVAACIMDRSCFSFHKVTSLSPHPRSYLWPIHPPLLLHSHTPTFLDIHPALHFTSFNLPPAPNIHTQAVVHRTYHRHII
ncbi:hypothetical protein FA13DRAFT_1181866 [Coprinellus micaceus]|uniref:Uncharacterized protein n=1 Tax=Coprinellus micaceus TaxID=71717 RepID=A0A4Y7RB91_COPMI|nr:hypothetical protein FA13DRAFT_1181866 [Coprinellus micaceus]